MWNRVLRVVIMNDTVFRLWWRLVLGKFTSVLVERPATIFRVKVGITLSFETSVNFYQTTRYHGSDYSILHGTVSLAFNSYSLLKKSPWFYYGIVTFFDYRSLFWGSSFHSAALTFALMLFSRVRPSPKWFVPLHFWTRTGYGFAVLQACSLSHPGHNSRCNCCNSSLRRVCMKLPTTQFSCLLLRRIRTYLLGPGVFLRLSSHILSVL